MQETKLIKLVLDRVVKKFSRKQGHIILPIWANGRDFKVTIDNKVLIKTAWAHGNSSHVTFKGSDVGKTVRIESI